MIPLEKIIVLSQTPLFSILKTEELNTISTLASEATYPDGHTLFYEGDTGDRLFIIVSGEVIILKKNQVGKEIPIVTLEENEFVGELSLFDTKARLTSARCSGKCTFLVITHNDLERLIHEYPTIALGFIKALISRMRSIIIRQTQK